MNRWILIACCLGLAAPAMAGLHLGLGSAVAKRSADLVNKAGDATPLTGDRVVATLPACPAGQPPFSALPTDMSMIGGIDPLGHVQPTGHTFPADHIYYYSSTMTAYAPPVYAPGDIHITEVDVSRYLNATPVFSDYSMTFYPCQNIRAVYGHVRTLSATILNQISGLPQTCSTYTTGTTTIERCAIYTNIVLSAGELIGTVQTSGTLDFGLSDYRLPPIAFVSPARHPAYQLYTACPVDYFTAGPKATMEAYLGRFDGGYHRVTAPLCGTIDQDVPGTAKGYWYHPGSPDMPEDPHLSLIDNNVYAPQQTISVGNALPNGGGVWYIFTPNSSGQVDREFSQVTADGTVYCYDTFFDPVGQSISNFSAPTFILQMLSGTSLKFEKQGVGGCGSGPWTFTSNAVTYQR